MRRIEQYSRVRRWRSGEGALNSNSEQVYADGPIEDHVLIRSLGLSSATSSASLGKAFLLAEADGHFDLRPPGEHSRPGIRAIFPPDRGGDARNPLLRAFGKRIVAIHDLTAGLGGDAYRLARAGYDVVAFERDPAIFALLWSSWEDAQAKGAVPSDIAARLAFRRSEGATEIDGIKGLDQGVYIDPMYPPARRASAKPRRELQVLRALLGEQTDAADLVRHARARAARVVVKRPHHASPLVERPSHVIESKLVRFDVYVNPGLLSEVAS
jgi:16S rRNA (guanine1516-N2)-methyltransferase